MMFENFNGACWLQTSSTQTLNIQAGYYTFYSAATISGSSGGTLMDLSQTWNTTGNPTAIKLNVTNTASGSSSNLMDLQVGGVSQFKVDKTGTLYSPSNPSWYLGSGISDSFGFYTGGGWGSGSTMTLYLGSPGYKDHYVQTSYSGLDTLYGYNGWQISSNSGIGFQVANSTKTVNVLWNTVFSGTSNTGSAATSLLDLSTTWNTTGAPTAIKLNVTNTASGASSNLLDLQVGGTSQLTVRKDGLTTITSNMIANGDYYLTQGGSTRIRFGHNGSFGYLGSNGGLYIHDTQNLNNQLAYFYGTGNIFYVKSQFLSTNTAAGSSTSNWGFLVNATTNQTGAANFTDLLINRTQTAAGTGTQLLLDAQVGGVSKFSVDNTGLVSDSIGNVRSIPQNAQTAAYVLAATDNGKHVSITTGGVTVNSGIFSVGQVVTIYNNSSSAQTITQGTSVTMYQAGTTNTGNRTLASYGVATILCVASNTFVITGSGLS